MRERETEKFNLHPFSVMVTIPEIFSYEASQTFFHYFGRNEENMTWRIREKITEMRYTFPIKVGGSQGALSMEIKTCEQKLCSTRNGAASSGWKPGSKT